MWQQLVEILPQIQKKFKIFFFWCGFCPQIRVKAKTKKRSLPQFGRVFGRIVRYLLELSVTFSSKRPGRFLLEGGGGAEFSLGGRYIRMGER